MQNIKIPNTKAYIGGEWHECAEKFPVFNPVDGQKITDVSDTNETDTKKAIEEAVAAQKSWARLLGKERSEILRKWGELILKKTDWLSSLLTLEQGKPFKESKGEVAMMSAACVEWAAEEAKRIYGETLTTHDQTARLIVEKQPIGVVGAITPWNFPHYMITRKVAPALAAGCAVILKPSEDTPLSALALAELAEEAGIPKGILNILPASDPVPFTKAIMEDERVRKISFTGSTEVGRILMRQASDHVKKLSLELGGNAPFIVFESANLEEAVQGLITCKFRNAGQTCVCPNRVYVHQSLYSAFVERFTQETEKLKVGNGLDESVSIGPLINEQGLKKVEELVQDALDKGAKIETGGKKHALGENFYTPTVLSNISGDMRFLKEEIFGPVAPIIAFEDEEDVIEQANDTIYGLAAYFYSQDYAQSWRVSEALEYGIIGINSPAATAAIPAPMGGVKQSGLGKEGGKYAVEEYLETKYKMFAGL